MQSIRRRAWKAVVPVLFFGLAAALLCFSTIAACAQESGGGGASVDEDLLKDLGDDLLEGLDDIPLDSSLKPNDSDDAGKSVRDQPLLDDLNDGEDIGQPSEDGPTHIARQMRAAQRRIEQQEVSQTTQQLQQDIVAQLDALIQQLQKKKSQQSSSASNHAAQSDQNIQQPHQPQEGQRSGDQPARDSTDRLGQQNAPVSDAAALEALVKQVWGHLPPRARQEMQNAAVEDFLPKYQQIIEDYYRRLAEEPPR